MSLLYGNGENYLNSKEFWGVGEKVQIYNSHIEFQ